MIYFGLNVFLMIGYTEDSSGERTLRNLFSIYWNDRELMIDLFWFRIVTYIVLIGYKEEGK